MSANTCMHVPACARCCDWCVFWHRVSEIAPHAQRHTAPHKAARSCLPPQTFRIWGDRQDQYFPCFYLWSSASYTHSRWVTDHNHMRGMNQICYSICKCNYSLEWKCVGLLFFFYYSAFFLSKHMKTLGLTHLKMSDRIKQQLCFSLDVI